MSEKKGRGKKITSALELLDREPYRTIIEVIYLLEKAEQQQIRCIINDDNEEDLYVKRIRNIPKKSTREFINNQKIYKKRTQEVKRFIQSHSDKPQVGTLTTDDVNNHLRMLKKWGIIEKIEWGSYQLVPGFKKEFVRKSNKEIIERYNSDLISDFSRITLYGLVGLREPLEKAAIDKQFAPEGLKHLTGMEYVNDIESKYLKIIDELWQLSSDIQNAKDYLVNVFLSKELKTKPPTIKEFFSQHDLVSLLEFQHMFKVLDSMKGFDTIEDDFHVKEIEIVKDYLHLHPEEQNTIKELLTKCKREMNKFAYPFTLFYSDAKFSPTPQTMDAAFKEARYKAIMENNLLSFEEKTLYIGELYLTPSDLAKLDAIKEERERHTQEIQEKLKELGNKYDDNTPLGDIPEVCEIIEKRLEKALKERKVIEGES